MTNWTIRIVHTLEQVKRLNGAIRRHQQEAKAGVFIFDQSTEMKNRLTDELRSLLLQNTETPWQIAA
jgi:hypothetical protein